MLQMTKRGFLSFYSGGLFLSDTNLMKFERYKNQIKDAIYL